MDWTRRADRRIEEAAGMNVRMLWLRWSLVLVVLSAAACGRGTGTSEVGGEDTAGAADVAAQDAAASDLPEEDVASDAGDPDTVTPLPELPPEFTCGEPDELVPCDATGPAPSDAATIAQWAGDNAVPLRCTDALGEHWDFDILVSEFSGMGVFFMGEIHGSAEIGPASADLFEALVFGAGVSVAALEMGMDTTDALNEYVLTGDEAVLDDGFFWGQYGDNMFRKTIPRRAREIYEETGIHVQVIGVDVPQRLAWVNERIEELAQDLGAQARGLLLDVIPEPKEPPYGVFGMGLDTAYVNLAKSYHQHLLDHQDVICAELDDEACEDLEFLAWALYTGAVFNSTDFQMAMMGRGGNPLDMMAWMNEREFLLEHNLRRAAPNEAAVVYAHMGAAHCAKGGWNVAGLLDAEHPPLQGRVYSVTPAYGQGSKVFYGMGAQPVAPEPTALAGLLSQLPLDNYFVSTGHPGRDCSENPFSGETAYQVGVSYGTGYDAFFWYHLLTPEQAGWGGWGKPSPGEDWRADFIRDQVERMRFADTKSR